VFRNPASRYEAASATKQELGMLRSSTAARIGALEDISDVDRAKGFYGASAGVSMLISRPD
jgi:hypothetical protein